MRYKILLAGNNQSLIEDFFAQMTESFESLTTSTRYDDIISHIKYFSPDVFVYCIRQEAPDRIARISNAKTALTRKKIPLIVVGTEEDCDTFVRATGYVADLLLTRPLTPAAIQERIEAYLTDKKQKEKEEATMAEVQASLAFAEAQAKAAAAENARRKHILVVDDDPMMLKLIKEHLHQDYDIATAINGKVALKFLENKKTDLILLDYEMPLENGASGKASRQRVHKPSSGHLPHRGHGQGENHQSAFLKAPGISPQAHRQG